ARAARVNWLPQETILFDGCSLERSLTIELQEGAALLLAEPLVFGRLEMGEALTSAHVQDRIEVRRAGIPIYLDCIRLAADVQEQLDRPGVAGGARAMASLLYVAPDAEAQLALLRRFLPRHAGASLLHEDVLVMRMLSRDSNEMRSSLVPMLDHLSHGGLPRCWNI
ncbi:MAG: urease accessory protein UreD, partial [Boseongicola sp. SB0673_bin_14]|nr:urease accessory protein UreD [Boseongicola sp. SB0673_bin_14]